MGNKEVALGGKTDHFYGVYSLRKSIPIPFSYFWEREKRHTREWKYISSPEIKE